MSNKFLVVVVGLLAVTNIFSCKKTEDGCDETPVTKENLQGRWTHDYPTKMSPNFTHPDEYNHIQFVNDSFFLEVTHRGDYIDASGCDKIYWKEYARGTFNIMDKNLHYSGVYTDSNFAIKTGGCYHIGQYVDSFKAHHCNNYLVLYSLSLSRGYSDSYRLANMVKE
jgi:hypothetical protein